MKNKLRVFVFTSATVFCTGVFAQQGALLEACNALEDKDKRLACFKELTSQRPATDSSAVALKTLKASFFAIAGLVDAGTSLNQYRAQLPELARALGVYKGEAASTDVSALRHLDKAVGAYNDAATLWAAHIYDSQDGGAFFGRVLNYEMLGLTNIVNRYSLPTTTVLFNSHVPIDSALPLIWSYARREAEAAFRRLERSAVPEAKPEGRTDWESNSEGDLDGKPKPEGYYSPHYQPPKPTVKLRAKPEGDDSPSYHLNK